MARFFMGQRVRVVSCDDTFDAAAMETVGKEGVVNEFDCVNEADVGGMIGVTISGNPDWCYHPHEIEPITPEGHQPAEYSYTELMDRLKSGVTA